MCRLTPCAPPPIATTSFGSIEASAMTGQGVVDPNGVMLLQGGALFGNHAPSQSRMTRTPP